jgi:hypothetical protein
MCAPQVLIRRVQMGFGDTNLKSERDRDQYRSSYLLDH